MDSQFLVGYHRFHDDEELNYQLNRFLYGARLEDYQQAAGRIRDLSDWTREMLALAEQAEQDGRKLNALTYYRAAEFFIAPDDPACARVYQRFIELFNELTSEEPYERHEVPYEGAALPAMRLAVDNPKDVLVMHGGFDSFLEELYPLARFFRDAGYEVIQFEGPGQGAALKRHGLTMIPEWERPVAAVLDFFGIESCSLLGTSLGGYLAPRAAAFEPRIQRVIAFDVLDDFLDCMAHSRGALVIAAARFCLTLRAKRLLNAMVAWRMRSDLTTAWGIPQGMSVMGVDNPYDLMKKVRLFNTAGFSGRIKQDFLLLAGEEDHYVPMRQFYRQARRLDSVRSLTTRVFTKAEHAQAHCQMGNLGLALSTIVDWLDERLESAAETSRRG